MGSMPFFNIRSRSKSSSQCSIANNAQVNRFEEEDACCHRSRRKSRQNSSTSLQNTAESTEKHVRFSSIHVRFYSISLGDSPAVSCGPPLAIGKQQDEEVIISVDDYEESNPSECRCKKKELILSHDEREVLLFNQGYALEEIMEASRIATKERNLRLRSARQAMVQQQQKEAQQRVEKRMCTTILRRREQIDRAVATEHRMVAGKSA